MNDISFKTGKVHTIKNDQDKIQSIMATYKDLESDKKREKKERYIVLHQEEYFSCCRIFTRSSTTILLSSLSSASSSVPLFTFSGTQNDLYGLMCH